jgi:hypothetical protein
MNLNPKNEGKADSRVYPMQDASQYDQVTVPDPPLFVLPNDKRLRRFVRCNKQWLSVLMVALFLVSPKTNKRKSEIGFSTKYKIPHYGELEK